jgi:hypothetical protein
MAAACDKRKAGDWSEPITPRIIDQDRVGFTGLPIFHLIRLLTPEDDPGRHACYRGARRHIMQDDTACADFGIAADLDIAKYLCPSTQQHTVAHFRMSVAALLSGAAESHLMQD